MAEVLVEFDAAIPAADGDRYAPRACARLGRDGLWEGWIEFTNVESGGVLRSGRETTQPTRNDVMYWATGLSRVYLEGALARALGPTRRIARPTIQSAPAFDGPAPLAEPADVPYTPRAVIDPFEVYAQGEHVLRQELLALNTDHLRAIIKAYALDGGAGAHALTPEVLAEYIVAEVRSRVDAAQSASGVESPYRDAGGEAR
jgi:hypothetical protein